MNLSGRTSRKKHSPVALNGFMIRSFQNLELQRWLDPLPLYQLFLVVKIILSNCGDPQDVLCRRTQTIPLTVDHKAR